VQFYVTMSPILLFTRAPCCLRRAAILCDANIYDVFPPCESARVRERCRAPLRARQAPLPCARHMTPFCRCFRHAATPTKQKCLLPPLLFFSIFSDYAELHTRGAIFSSLLVYNWHHNSHHTNNEQSYNGHHNSRHAMRRFAYIYEPLFDVFTLCAEGALVSFAARYAAHAMPALMLRRTDICLYYIL